MNTFAARRILENIGQVVRCDRPDLTNEADSGRGPANNFFRRQTQLPQLMDAAVSGALAQLLATRFPNQRMVCKAWASRASEHLPQTKLASRG